MKPILTFLLLLPTCLIGQQIREEAYILPDSVLGVLAKMDKGQMGLDETMAKGIALLKKNQYDSAIATLQSIKEQFSEVSDANHIELSYLVARGFYFKGDYTPAISNILEAVALSEQIESNPDIVFTKRFAGELYRASDNPDVALKYLNEALALGYQINDQLGIAYSLNRLGVIAYQEGDHEKADSLFQLSMPIAIALDDSNVISMNLNDMGEVYNNAKDFERSLDLYQQALKLPLDLDMRINAMINVARTHVSMGNHREAIDVGQKALDMADEAKILTLAVDAARVIADGYMIQGKNAEGIQYYRLYMNYRGRLFEARKNAEILELETKYESDKNRLLVETKDLEIKRQEERIQNFIIGSIILVFLLVVIVYLYFRSRKFQRELMVLNKTKDKLFAIVSHDLRNALTSFEGIGAIIGKYVKKQEYVKVERLVGEFDRESRAVYLLLDNLLNWSVSQLKDSPFQPETLILKPHVEKSIELFEGIAAQKGIRIDVEMDPALVVIADANALSLIFRNFISNAIKYTPKGGTIVIKAKQNVDKVEILIADTGIGFTQTQLAEIQSEKGMISKEGTSGEQGTGLGLTLCLEYLELHRSVLSTEPNHPSGTVFKFELAMAA